jgi:hypothetical protein
MPVSVLGSLMASAPSLPHRQQLKGLGAGIGVADLGQVQASVAPADIATHEQRTEGLAQCAEAVGNTAVGTDHVARLEPGGSR